MITLILVFLILLWFLGFLNVPLFATSIFQTGGHIITLNDLLLFLVILWLVGILPYPFQEIASVLLLLWLLATLGIIAIAGFSTIIEIALIVGVIAFIARMTGVS